MVAVSGACYYAPHSISIVKIQPRYDLTAHVDLVHNVVVWHKKITDLISSPLCFCKDALLL